MSGEILARTPLKPRTLRDPDIRPAVLIYAEALQGRQLVVTEMGIARHTSRIDLAAICEDRMEGFEIKSDADSHSRFAAQASAWAGIFDLLTLVVTKKHLEKIQGGKAVWSRIVPEWWGLILAESRDEEVRLIRVREPERNPDGLDLYRLSQCFWKCEIEQMARKLLGWTAKQAREPFYRWPLNSFRGTDPALLAAELRKAYLKRSHLKREPYPGSDE